MAQRGRKSTAKLSVVAGSIHGQIRPEPPSDLPERQAALWRAIVESEPIDLFKTVASQMMLRELVRYADTSDTLAVKLNEMTSDDLSDPESIKHFGDLLKMRDVVTKQIAALATKLRISNQAKYLPNKVARATRDLAVGRKPWE
jgi:hypothetical protein